MKFIKGLLILLSFLLFSLGFSGCLKNQAVNLSIDSVPVGMVETTMDGTIVYSNLAYQKMLGYSLEELKKLTYQELTPPKWHEMEKEIVEKAMKDDYVKFQKEYIKKDGNTLSIELSGWIIKDKDGNAIGTSSIVRVVEDN
ncbi:MAG: PAS domain S-box protein [bacterium]